MDLRLTKAVAWYGCVLCMVCTLCLHTIWRVFSRSVINPSGLAKPVVAGIWGHPARVQPPQEPLAIDFFFFWLPTSLSLAWGQVFGKLVLCGACLSPYHIHLIRLFLLIHWFIALLFQVWQGTTERSLIERNVVSSLAMHEKRMANPLPLPISSRAHRWQTAGK